MVWSVGHDFSPGNLAVGCKDLRIAPLIRFGDGGLSRKGRTELSLKMDPKVLMVYKIPNYVTLNNNYIILINIIEGSLEVKLPTIWADEKQSRAEAERRGRLEERRSEEKESEERRCRCAKG